LHSIASLHDALPISDKERSENERAIAESVSFAFEFVQARVAMRARRLASSCRIGETPQGLPCASPSPCSHCSPPAALHSSRKSSDRKSTRLNSSHQI